MFTAASLNDAVLDIFQFKCYFHTPSISYNKLHVQFIYLIY
jgi:hypothetical protein